MSIQYNTIQYNTDTDTDTDNLETQLQNLPKQFVHSVRKIVK